jgi:hypothetical protein
MLIYVVQSASEFTSKDEFEVSVLVLGERRWMS